MEGFPEKGQPIHAVKAEELGDAVGMAGRAIELEIHRRPIATKSEEDALTEAEQSGKTPDQINAEGHDRQGKETT